MRDAEEIKYGEHGKEDEQADDDLLERRSDRHAGEGKNPSDEANERDDDDECDKHFQ